MPSQEGGTDRKASQNAGARKKVRGAKSVSANKARKGKRRLATASSLYGKYFLRISGRKVSGFDLGTDLGVADAIKAGVSTNAVDDVIDSGAVDSGVMYDVVVPRRTLAHRKSKDQPLTPEESDRLARVLRVYARSEEALGDSDRAYRWLCKRNRALNGKTPIELLHSEAGARAVEKVLGRIEHGVFS